MKYIIIQEGYDPFPDPNSICTKAIVNGLNIDSNNSVFIICDGYVGYESKFDKSSRIIHVPVRLEKSFSNVGIFHKIMIILKRVAIIPIWPIRFPGKVRKYYKAARRIINNSGEDTVVISVYRPAETVEAGYLIKKAFPQVKHIIYNLDGIGPNFIKHPNCLTEYMEKKWTNKVYIGADVIIQMICHKKEIENSYLRKTLRKTIFSDFPLVKNETKPNQTTCKTILNAFIYAGSFYPNLREPFYLMEWFDQLCTKDNDIQMICYSEGNYQLELENKQNENSRFIRKDYIPSELLDEEIQKCRALISIGNKHSSMVPSKLFAYISSKKPIIHFVHDSNDSSISYLKKYPLSLILNMNDSMQVNVDKCVTFLESIDNRLIGLEGVDIEKIFIKNTPEYTVLRILKSIDRCNNGYDDKWSD